MEEYSTTHVGLRVHKHGHANSTEGGLRQLPRGVPAPRFMQVAKGSANYRRYSSASFSSSRF